MATFVMVHGAGTGGWLFDDVAGRLTAAGHRVYAPSLVGVGELATPDAAATDVTTHVEQVAALVEAQALSEVVLVGFIRSWPRPRRCVRRDGRCTTSRPVTSRCCPCRRH